MADVISAQFGSEGEERLANALQIIIAQLQRLNETSDKVAASMSRIASIEKTVSDNTAAVARSTSTLASQMTSASGAAESEMSALRQLNIAIAGSPEKLEAMRKGIYAATQESLFFSQMMFAHPIQALQAFAQSENKAAIAGEYFSAQLGFIAASRFGIIVLWSAAIGSIIAAFREGVIAGNELENAVRNVESAFIGGERTLASYGDIQAKLTSEAIRYGETFENVGKVMWELKSAGLEASDAFAGVDVNLKLVKAGVSNLEQSTRLTSAIFRIFGDSIKDASTAQEKFAVIGDTLAVVLNKSQADMDGIVQGFKYVIATADLASFSFAQVSAYLSVLNNRMLFGSQAGTSLVNSFIQLSKNADTISEKFGLIIDKNKTMGEQFDTILGQLHTRFASANLSVEQLGAFFESMNIRGGRALAALIKGYDELVPLMQELRNRTGNLNGALDEITQKNIDALTEQWGRFLRLTQTLAAGALNDIRTELRDILKLAVDFAQASDTLQKKIGSGSFHGIQESTITQFSKALSELKGIADSVSLANILKLFYAGGQVVAGQNEAAATPWQQLKNIIEQVNNEAVKYGAISPDATNKASVAVKRQVTDFTQLLEGERLEQYQLLLTNETLDEKISKTADAVLKAEAAAVAAANGQKADEEVNKLLDIAIHKREQLNALVQQQTDQNNRAIFEENRLQTEGFNILENTALRFKEISGQIPVDQMQLYLNNLQAAERELIVTENDHKRLNKALQDWGNAAAKVAENYKIVDASIEKAIASSNTLNGLSNQLAQAYKDVGDNLNAVNALRDMENQARQAIDLARTDEQRLKALEAYVNALKSEVSSGLLPADQAKAVQYDIIRTLEQERQIQQNITSSYFDQAQAAKDKLSESDTTLAMSERVASAIALWPTNMKEAVDALAGDSGLNSQLEKTLSLASSVADALSKLKDAGTFSVNSLNGSLGDLESALNDYNSRRAY